MNRGDVHMAEAKCRKILTAGYQAPYLAHTTPEPMCCVAEVREDSAEFWVPTQADGNLPRTNPVHAETRVGSLSRYSDAGYVALRNTTGTLQPTAKCYNDSKKSEQGARPWEQTRSVSCAAP